MFVWFSWRAQKSVEKQQPVSTKHYRALRTQYFTRRKVLHWINSRTNVFINGSCSFPERARSYRFTILDRLPKKKKNSLQVTKLTSCMDFRMIQAVIKYQQSRDLTRFLDSFVCHTSNSIYAAFIQLMFTAEVQNWPEFHLIWHLEYTSKSVNIQQISKLWQGRI